MKQATELKGTYKELINELKKIQISESVLGKTEESVERYLKVTPTVNIHKDSFLFKLVETTGNTNFLNQYFKLDIETYGLSNILIAPDGNCLHESIIPEYCIFEVYKHSGIEKDKTILYGFNSSIGNCNI